MLSIDKYGRVSVGSKINFYGLLGTRETLWDTCGHLLAPYGHVSVVSKIKWLIIYKNRGRKRAQKSAQKRAYEAPENAPKFFDLERQYLKNNLLCENAQPLIESVFSIPFYQVLGHFLCFSSSRVINIQRKFGFF